MPPFQFKVTKRFLICVVVVSVVTSLAANTFLQPPYTHYVAAIMGLVSGYLFKDA